MFWLQFNFSLLPFTSNFHIVWQYVAWLLPVSVKSQDESSQQVDGLEMRSLSEDTSKLQRYYYSHMELLLSRCEQQLLIKLV